MFDTVACKNHHIAWNINLKYPKYNIHIFNGVALTHIVYHHFLFIVTIETASFAG